MKSIIYSLIVVILCSSKMANASSSLFMTKSASSVSEGSHVTLDVKVKATDQAINAVSGSITFPADLLQIVSISRDSSILNIWTHDPNISRNKISFEGVILSPGYQGEGGSIFRIMFEAKKRGLATVAFSEGSILANDGQGTNIIDGLFSTNFNIIGVGALDLASRPIAQSSTKQQALPVITDYPLSINSKEVARLKGKGEPNAMTKISFEDVSHKSYGEKFLDYIQSKKKRFTDVLVKNDNNGQFEYVSPSNLVAGAYNATPFLVDTKSNLEKPGLGVQLLVNDSKIVKALIVLINVLLLLIPIVTLIMFIYFIPWYSSRRMRILKRKMGLEEERIVITEHELERQDKILSNNSTPVVTEKKQ